MKKNLLFFLLILALLLSSVGCTQSVNAPVAENPAPVEASASEEPPEPELEPEPEKSYKIGIITGTETQCAEEFYAAMRMKQKYGDIIEISSYPDIFEPKPETLMLNMKALADDGAQAIVIAPCFSGTSEAIEKLRERYPDMLFICGSLSESPELVAANADIALSADDEEASKSIILQARKMGAKVFVHYTFARHMGDEALAARRDIFMQTCEEEGLQFVDATIPDPMEVEPGEAGKYVMSDVPLKVQSFGKDTAFYSTEDSVQDELIKTTLWEGALFPVQCQSSPIYGYPEALGIEIPYDKKGDVDYVIEQIKQELTAKGGEGRFSTWSIQVSPLIIEAGTEYAKAFLDGSVISRNDSVKLMELIGGIEGGAVSAQLKNYESESGKTLENFYVILPDFINF